MSASSATRPILMAVVILAQVFSVATVGANLPPAIDAIGDKSACEGVLLTFTVTASDPDSITVTLSATGLPTGASFQSTPGNPVSGTFSWVPSEAQGPGSYYVTFTATDDSGLSSSQTITIIVPDCHFPPVLAVPGPQTVNELALLTFTVSCTDTDLPADTLTITATGFPAGATFSSTPGASPRTGTFSWTPTEAQGPGSYTVNFTCTESSFSLSDTEGVSIFVNEANSAPVLILPGPLEGVCVGDTLAFTVKAIDSDIPTNTITLSAAGLVAGMTFSPVTGVSPVSGEFSFTPSAAQNGLSFAINFTATDNGTPSLSDARAVTIIVVAACQLILSVPGPQAVNEETLLIFTVSASNPDPVGDITLSASGLPAGAIFSSVPGNPVSGVFNWTPTEAQGPGNFIITFIAADSLQTVSGTVSITVFEANRPPILQPVGDKTIQELVSLIFPVAALDSDIPANIITLTATGLPPGATFSAVPGGMTGTFSWTPTESQGGVYAVTFTATDNGIPPLSDDEVVTITVVDTQCLPVLFPVNPQAVDQGSSLTFTVTAVIGCIPSPVLTLSASGLPPGATFTSTPSTGSVTGTFSWTPTQSQPPGDYLVTFTVTTGTLPPTSDSELVIITVREARVPLQVLIDIKPGGDPNSINIKSQGLLPVAILSTVDFDASDVDPSTVRFGRVGTEASPVRFTFEDVGGSSAPDMVFWFDFSQTQLRPGDTMATLTGRTLDGQQIIGTDSVRVFFPGDVNGDLTVDLLDLVLLGRAFGSVPNSSNWNPNADFNQDGRIDIQDLATVGQYFGQHA